MVVLTVPKQEMMTRDNVPVTVDAVVYFRVVEPEAAITKVENFLRATLLVAQTTLRSVIGPAELDELLSQRERINQRLEKRFDFVGSCEGTGRTKRVNPTQNRVLELVVCHVAQSIEVRRIHGRGFPVPFGSTLVGDKSSAAEGSGNCIGVHIACQAP